MTSHKVEHPMTVMYSPAPIILTLDIWFGGESKWDYSECLIYNSWTYRTLNGKKINGHNCLN